MAEIGQVRNMPFPWPAATHSIKPTGQQQRQPDKHKQHQDKHDEHDDEDGFNHIDEYA